MKMIRNLRYLSTAGVAAMWIAMAQPASADIIIVPPVPADIKVPAGHSVFMKGNAAGTQNYICLPSATGFAWKLFGPQATLFLTFKLFNIEAKQQIMTHYLSANPDESETPRPTWQSSLDTSAIWGKAVVPSSDPAYVAAGAIPWLLVEVVGSEPGPTGGTMMTPAKFIQRVNTTGGSAPATGCSLETNVGATTLVPYTADYYFFRAGN
jgi:Protein of unknown function (DUF3455)